MQSVELQRVSYTATARNLNSVEMPHYNGMRLNAN